MFFEVDEYNRILLAPEYAYSREEKVEVDGLMSRLRAASGHPVPLDIDAAFRRLGKERLGLLGIGNSRIPHLPGLGPLAHLDNAATA